VAVAVAILIAGTSCSGEENNGRLDVLRQTGSAFAAIAEKATPAVVFIKAEKTVAVGVPVQPFGYNDPFGFFGDDFLQRFFHGHGSETPRYQPREFKQMGQGSGFLISKDGYILTNHHVVGDADKITVKLHDGREFDAERIGTDEKSEVAVIKIKEKNLPYLELGDSATIRVGEWVVAIGNPFGLAATLTAGVVSAKGRSGIGIADYENFIQTDAAINPGNSGGPLLNIDGEVVGINTAIYSKSGGYMGIGFAIPIDMARSIKEQLVKSGKVTRGYLGVIIQEVTGDLAESFGLKEKHGILVSDVSEDSPAENAGLKQGDIILRLNGKETDKVSEFRNDIAANPPGTSLTLTIFRNGDEKEIKLKTGELPDDIRVAASSSELIDKLGLSVQNLSEETARKFGYEIGEGVFVSKVEQSSLAWQAGIQPGNLITSVNRERVATVQDFLQAAGKAEKNGTMLLRVRDGAYSRYVVLRFE
jgi:serine protease Do